MDSLITAAARALAVGDPLGALKRIALRDDPPALALRGTALAQLGDLARSRVLLRRAARAYGPHEALSRARCLVAEAEIALASRDLNWSPSSLEGARMILEAHGDRLNAIHARYLEIRRLLLIGLLDEAERCLGERDPHMLPAALRTVHELIIAGIAARRVQARTARRALVRAERAAREAGIPALEAEVAAVSCVLRTPAGRLITQGTGRDLLLEEVEDLLSSEALIVDACRFRVCEEGLAIELIRRPVLFTLARLLAEAWPADVARATLVARAFRGKRADATYRARLRVEIGRLRRVLRSVAEVTATKQGFLMVPRRARNVVVLAPAVENDHTPVLALLAEGESWSSSGLALALGASTRTVQRALESLARRGKVHAMGHGRAQRWMSSSLPGFTTSLLLPPLLPGD